jgi:aspartyl-tRNA(Asn)/glutamyl-tRNA(Gln) amidotransferase subunit A
MTEPWSLTIAEALTALERGTLSAVELTQALLRRIAAIDPGIRAYLAVDGAGALAQAEAADARRRAGQARPLEGIPLGIKDVISTRGVTTTCGSRLLANYTPVYDATVIGRLHDAGAVVLGKLNCDEFAMGSSTEHSAFAVTRNPWNPERVPGGSSGGSAAAVAAGLALGTLGTDTGGSIRQPAALCGVTGLKPTYGRVSRYGLVAFASSLDQIGPMAWTARDCALLLSAIAGHDPHDGTSATVVPADYAAALVGDVRGLRIGVPREFFVAGMQPAVEAAVRTAIAVLRDAGATVSEVSLPHSRYALPVYYLIAPAEASANLARYDGVRFGVRGAEPGYWSALEQTRGAGFGAEVRRRIMLGTYALSAGYYDAYYRRAQQVRTLIRRDYEQVFGQVDVLAAPTTPSVAFRIGEHQHDPLAMYLEDVCTLPANLAGIPGLVVPCGQHDGLPIGLQLLGRPFDEATLLRVGDAYQRVTSWHAQRPALA